MDERSAFLWLNNVEGLSRRKFSMLLKTYGSALDILSKSVSELAKIPVIGSELASKILCKEHKQKTDGIMLSLEKMDANAVIISDYNYPSLLKEIFDPPYVLYYTGELPCSDEILLSVVGARRCTTFGQELTLKFSKELAENGVSIVSGMARGIDSMAHIGAIQGNGKTYAVLGSGLDVIYPPENKTLYKQISENGCVMTEFPLKTRPLKQNFPARNRVISGLSQATLVVEAGEKSGTLITARTAIEQNRDVFAIPGKIHDKQYAGTNRLIKESSAALVTEVSDILFLLGINETKQDKFLYEKNITEKLEPFEKAIYDIIGVEPAGIDDIVRKSGQSAQNVQFILTSLEIGGYIKALPGHRYIKVF